MVNIPDKEKISTTAMKGNDADWLRKNKIFSYFMLFSFF